MPSVYPPPEIDNATDYDEQFGYSGRFTGHPADDRDGTESAEAALRMQSDLADIERARASDEAERILHAEMLAAHHVVKSAVGDAGEVRIGKETVCRDWAGGPAEFRTEITCLVIDGLEMLGRGVGDSPMAAAVRAVEDYAARTAKVA